MAVHMKVNTSAAARQVAARLQAIAKSVAPELKQAMALEADKTVSVMRALAPVLKRPHKDRKAGALRNSIGWTWGEPKFGAAVLRSRSKKRVKFAGAALVLTLYAGSADVYYARWIEFGTRPGRKDSAYSYTYMRRRRKKAYRQVNGKWVTAPEYYQVTHARAVYRTHPGTKGYHFFYGAWKVKRKEARKAIRRAWRKAIKDGARAAA